MVGRGQPGVLHRLADAERRASRETHLHDAVRFLRRFDARARRSAWRLLAGWPRHGAGEVVAVSPKWPRRARSLYRLRRVPRERRRANRRSRLRAVYRLSGRVAAGSYGCRWASASRQNHGKPWIFPARRVFLAKSWRGVRESRPHHRHPPVKHSCGLAAHSVIRERSADWRGHDGLEAVDPSRPSRRGPNSRRCPLKRMRVSESHSANAQPAHPADHRCTHLRNVRGRSECRLASGTRLRAPCEAHAEP